ncbi:MAG: hypothetical protein JXC33_03370 [Deltaproteobacteria bacterium]|nr:hypothetical protein [Deltaproteobacteria bacterium]
MNSRFHKFFFIVFLVPFLVGMGSIFGEDSPDKIPVPELKYTAMFIDQMDVITECTEVSIQGKTYLEGKKGEGLYTIPFENIKSILFMLKKGELTGIVKLRDGSKTTLILMIDHKAYGKAHVGTFQIKLINLKKMEFLNKDKK